MKVIQPQVRVAENIFFKSQSPEQPPKNYNKKFPIYFYIYIFEEKNGEINQATLINLKRKKIKQKYTNKETQ